MPSLDSVAPPDRLYTLADLDTWSFSGPSLAVVGRPVNHSLSPPMHRAALRELAEQDPRLGNWSYFRFEVAPEDFAAALPRFREKGFIGLNLTVPHKVQAVSLVKEIDPTARAMGAVNTLSAIDGGWAGFNTDGPGLVRALRQELGTEMRGRDVVLLGAGGAARALAVQALREGCRFLWIGNRSHERLHELLKAILPPLTAEPLPVKGFLFDELPYNLPSAPLLINATTQGLKPDDALPLSLKPFGAGTQIYDTTYGCRNRWRAEAAERDWDYADGLGMLVAQGALSLQRWTGRESPEDTMRRAVALALAARIA